MSGRLANHRGGVHFQNALFGMHHRPSGNLCCPCCSVTYVWRKCSVIARCSKPEPHERSLGWPSPPVRLLAATTIAALLVRLSLLAKHRVRTGMWKQQQMFSPCKNSRKGCGMWLRALGTVKSQHSSGRRFCGPGPSSPARPQEKPSNRASQQSASRRDADAWGSERGVGREEVYLLNRFPSGVSCG